MTIQNWSRSEKLALILWGLVGCLLLTIAAQKDQTRETKMVGQLVPVEILPRPMMPQEFPSAISLEAPIDPRSKTPAIAGGNEGPAGQPSCSIQVVSGFQFEICQEYPAASEIQDNNSITIDGVIDITHETSQAPNPEFRWI